MSVSLLTRGMVRSCCQVMGQLELITSHDTPEAYTVLELRPEIKDSKVEDDELKPVIVDATEE